MPLLDLVFHLFFRIMSPVKNNVGRGLNIALVNGELPPRQPHHALSRGEGSGTFIQPTLAQLLPRARITCCQWGRLAGLVGAEGLKALVLLKSWPGPCHACLSQGDTFFL